MDVSKHKDIANRLNFFAGLGFVSGPQLARLVRKCPALLYVSDLETIGTTFDSLSAFFPRKPVSFFFIFNGGGLDLVDESPQRWSAYSFDAVC